MHTCLLSYIKSIHRKNVLFEASHRTYSNKNNSSRATDPCPRPHPGGMTLIDEVHRSEREDGLKLAGGTCPTALFSSAPPLR